MYAVNKNTFDTQLGTTRKTHPNELLNAIKKLEKNIKTKIEDNLGHWKKQYGPHN